MENVLTVSWYLMKKMKTGFGCAVTGVTIGIALPATKFQLKTVYLMNFIIRNAHKIVRLFLLLNKLLLIGKFDFFGDS